MRTRKREWRLPSPGAVIGSVALFVALGGTGYAAISVSGDPPTSAKILTTLPADSGPVPVAKLGGFTISAKCTPISTGAMLALVHVQGPGDSTANGVRTVSFNDSGNSLYTAHSGKTTSGAGAEIFETYAVDKPNYSRAIGDFSLTTATKVVELHVAAFVDNRTSAPSCTFYGSLIRPAG